MGDHKDGDHDVLSDPSSVRARHGSHCWLFAVPYSAALVGAKLLFLSTATTDDTGCRPNVVRTVATRERSSEYVIEMRAAMSRLVTECASRAFIHPSLVFGIIHREGS